MKKANIFKSNVVKFISGGIFIFVFGIFVGYQLENNSISSIQGFLFNAVGEATDSNATNSNASDSNASDSNASDSNASDANASDSNASDANATSSNAQATDNILYLQSLTLDATNANAGDRVNVSVVTSGACNSAASIVFKNAANGVTFTASVNSMAGNQYITIPSNISAGTYNVVEIMLVGLNSDNSTFSRRYSTFDTSADYLVQLNNSLTINANNQVTNAQNNQTKLTLNSISLKATETNLNEKVYVDFNASEKISSLKLVFTNGNGQTMVVYVKALTNNPYFEVPTTTVIGNYSLTSATLVSSSSTVIYSKDGSITGSEIYNFNSNILVKDAKQQNNFVYNNEELTNDIIKALYNTKNDATINISADTNPIISEELFNAIKGTSKKLIISYNDNQVIFEGKSISNAKSIDASITTGLIQADSDIGKLVNDGILLNFASNGNLPGDAQVRIKITDEMKSKLGTEDVYVYYYNVQCDDFTEIATNIKPTDDGYYEFNLDHNSEYILVNKALDSELLSDGDGFVNFQRGDMVNLLLIGIGILLIIVVVVIIVVAKKKNNKQNGDKKTTDKVDNKSNLS